MFRGLGVLGFRMWASGFRVFALIGFLGCLVRDVKIQFFDF